MNIECSDPGGSSVDRRGIRAGVVPCTYEALTPGEFFGTGPILVAPPGDGFDYITLPDGSIGRRFPDGTEQRGYRTICGTSGGFRWVDVGVTVGDLIDDVSDRARQMAPLPVIDMNPRPDAGGIVNVGLWLAVEDVRPAPIRVEAGPLWAEADMQIGEVEWNMGNGDVVACTGTGVPIEALVPDLDTVDEGPCGYTFARSSPEDDPFRITVTVTWHASYRSSAGAGEIGPIRRSLTFDYDVDEVQTVGIAG